MKPKFTIIPNTHTDLVRANKVHDEDFKSICDVSFVPILAWVIETESHENTYESGRSRGTYVTNHMATPLDVENGSTGGNFNDAVYNLSNGDWYDILESGNGKATLIEHLNDLEYPPSKGDS